MISNLEIKIPNTIKDIAFGSEGIVYQFKFFNTMPFNELDLYNEDIDQVVFKANSTSDKESVLFNKTVTISSSGSTITELTLERENLKRGVFDLSIELMSLSGSTVTSKYKQRFDRLIKIS